MDCPLVHSDQGSTYASGDYQEQLADNKLLCSMSRKGECLDNAVAESFFGTLKNELVYHEDYHTRAQAKQTTRTNTKRSNIRDCDKYPLLV